MDGLVDRARGAARLDYARATVQGVVGVLHHDTASVGGLDTVAGRVLEMDGRTDIRARYQDEVVEGLFPEVCPRGCRGVSSLVWTKRYLLKGRLC